MAETQALIPRFAVPVHRWLGPIFAGGMATLLATLPAVWLGFEIVPDLPRALQVPVTMVLAAFVGLGAELSVRSAAAPRVWRQALGTVWFVPSGSVIVGAVWLSTVGSPSSALPPLMALGVLGLIVAQRLELAGPHSVRGLAHTVSIGAGFALAFCGYAFANSLALLFAAAAMALATLPPTLVVLRGTRSPQMEFLGHAGLTVATVGELALVLLFGGASMFTVASLLVIALYAVSGVCRAQLDGASGRVYAELAVTVGLALLAVGALAGGT